MAAFVALSARAKMSEPAKNKTCRICLKDEKFTISIFCDYAKELSIHTRIETYLQVKIERRDALPKYICYDCFSNLEFVERFVTTAKNSQLCLQAKGEEPDDSLFDDASFHTPPDVRKQTAEKHLARKKSEDLEFRNMSKKIRSLSKLQVESLRTECSAKSSLFQSNENRTVPSDEVKKETTTSPKSEDVFKKRKALLTDYYKQKCALFKNRS